MAAAKRRRLQGLIGLGGISDSTLCNLLGRLRENPIEEEIRRHTCHRAAREAIQDVTHKVDLPLVKGGQWAWTYLPPIALLCKMLSRSPQLAGEFKDALQENPNSHANPWGLILYFDELTPGAVLRLDNKRKCMAVYMSFAQLGHRRLCKTEFWMTIAVVRTSMIRKIQGGWSNMLRLLLRSAFLQSDSFATGVVLQLDAP